MALSSIIKLTCDQCGKVAVEKGRINFGNKKLISLECGHMVTESVMTSKDIAHILNNCTLWPYQVKGIQAFEQSNARMLLADEQGLGKTLQVLGLLKLHQKELMKALVVSPSSVSLQWQHEIIEKCGVQGFLTQVIRSGKELAAPGFDIYVTTYDLLKNEDTFKYVKDDIKTVIIDECQRIKDHLSGRAKAVQRVCKDWNIQHILPLSGTPIKNHAGEYFTVLNLVAPRIFPHYQTFIEKECDSYSNGYGTKVGGLRNPEAFHEKTKGIILRRTKAEVLPDLPAKTRKFFHCELDKRVNKAYAAALQELEDLYYSDDPMSSFERSSCMLAIMTKLRQVTAIGKVQNCISFLQEFIEGSEDRKIVVFAHHHSVVTMLEEGYNSWAAQEGQLPCLNLKAGSLEKKDAVVQEFAKSDKRVMVASTLAAGEGLNLQFCSDAVMLERQWNPPNEVQAEDRFHRFGQLWPVSIVYMIASETIDEYFTELVESKRAIIGSTMDNKEIQWDQTSLMSELASILVTKGKKSWSLK